jgi:hypothetical protein
MAQLTLARTFFVVDGFVSKHLDILQVSFAT